MMSDDDDKTPLPGGVIILQDTPFGANTDINGRYYINNLKPGTYTVKGKYAAYYPVIVSNVIITKGFTTKLKFLMTEHHLDQPDFTVDVADSMVTVNLKAKTITINIGRASRYKQNRIYFPDKEK